MGAFGAAVRGGMEKVAIAAPTPMPIFDPLSLNREQFFQAYYDPAHALTRQMQQDPDSLRAYLNRQAAERESIMQQASSQALRFKGRKPYELAAGDRGVMGAEAARHSAAADELARINLLRSRLGTKNYQTPAYGRGGVVGDLTMAAERAALEDAFNRNYMSARSMHGGRDMYNMLGEYGVGVGPASSVQADPRKGELAARMQRASEYAGVARPAKGGAGAGGPGFFTKYKGPLLGAAGVLGGGMLLSHMMRKKDERVQGPYGPVYR